MIRLQLAFIRSWIRLAGLLVIAALTLVNVALAQPAAPFSMTGTETLGVNIHFTNPKPGEMKMLAESGVRWVRMDLGWAWTERKKGEYDFSEFDQLMKALDEYKLRAVLILDYSNPLYEANQSVVTAEGRKAFARWAAAAVKHFKGRGVVWEIWNEPDIPNFWKPEPNVNHYVALARAACAAIKEAAPREVIVGPGCSSTRPEFLEPCFQGGLLEFWQAVTVHPYRQGAPESVGIEYHRLNRLIAKYAPQGKNVAVVSGEWGYSATWNRFDEDQQGKMLAREWLTNLSLQVPLSIWYDWHDDGTDSKDPEHHFGMVKFEYHQGRDPVYDPKHAYTAAKTLTSTFKGYQFVKRLATGDQDDYALLFRNRDQLILAVWTTSVQSHEISIPLKSDVHAAVNYLGQSHRQVSVASNQLTIGVSDSPVYVTLDGPDPQLLDAAAIHVLQTTVSPMTDSLDITVENLGMSAFSGRIHLMDVEAIQVAQVDHRFQLNDSDEVTTIRIPWKRSDSAFRFGLRVENEQGVAMWKQPARRYSMASEWSAGALEATPDGDRAVECEASLNLVKDGGPSADSIPAPAHLRYRFGEGWKFLRVAAKGEQRKIPGEPTAFGVWIDGDAKLATARMRLVDASGQTWQADGPVIDWKGWKYVELPLRSTSAHWGGANDGRIHYPLKWDSSLLLDNTSRKPLSGEISFTAPIAIE